MKTNKTHDLLLDTVFSLGKAFIGDKKEAKAAYQLIKKFTSLGVLVQTTESGTVQYYITTLHPHKDIDSDNTGVKMIIDNVIALQRQFELRD